MHNNQRSADWGVIFDLDGTMVCNTSYHRQAWFELCKRHNIPMDTDLYYQKVHARSNDKIVPNLLGDGVSQAFIQQIEDEKETLYRKIYKPFMKPNPGLLPLLDARKTSNIPCGAATHSPRDNVDFVLDGLNLRPYFKSVFYRDLVKHGKPDPQLLLKTAEGLGLPPQRCILFEDSASGFKAARAAQMPYIVITAGADPAELKEAADAAAIIEDFSDVSLDWLAAVRIKTKRQHKSA
ncbi:MAG TPA: HAD family phosphatase [Anaerohalosphaeraceae bacterium]|nr:HAD family phosphatase [Anaerohalosphaeraceae bacterium]